MSEVSRIAQQLHERNQQKNEMPKKKPARSKFSKKGLSLGGKKRRQKVGGDEKPPFGPGSGRSDEEAAEEAWEKNSKKIDDLMDV